VGLTSPPLASLAQVEPGYVGREAKAEEGWADDEKTNQALHRRWQAHDARRPAATHDYLADIEVISHEMRIVVESEWLELVHKLPPRR